VTCSGGWFSRGVGPRDSVSETTLLEYESNAVWTVSLSYFVEAVHSRSEGHTPRSENRQKIRVMKKSQLWPQSQKRASTGFFLLLSLNGENLRPPFTERRFSRSPGRRRRPRDSMGNTHWKQHGVRTLSLIRTRTHCTRHYDTAGVVEGSRRGKDVDVERLRRNPLARGELVVPVQNSCWIQTLDAKRFGDRIPGDNSIHARIISFLVFLVEDWKRRWKLKRVCFKDGARGKRLG